MGFTPKKAFEVVLSKDPDFDLPTDQAVVVREFQDALQIAKEKENVFVIGGQQVYQLFLPYADRIKLTHVDGSFPADRYFPLFDERKFNLIEVLTFIKDERHKYDFEIFTYERRGVKKREEVTATFMDFTEFVNRGYLQEVNRNWFHPLGLGLMANRMSDGRYEFAGIIDARNIPEGCAFAWDSLTKEQQIESKSKFEWVNAEWNKRIAKRKEALGYGIQPIIGGVYN